MPVVSSAAFVVADSREFELEFALMAPRCFRLSVKIENKQKWVGSRGAEWKVPGVIRVDSFPNSRKSASKMRGAFHGLSRFGLRAILRQPVCGFLDLFDSRVRMNETEPKYRSTAYLSGRHHRVAVGR
jgi:hypothetical protein